MSTISTQLRNFKEPTKEQQTHLFFALPPERPAGEKDAELEKMECQASLVLSGEEVFVSVHVRSLARSRLTVWMCGDIGGEAALAASVPGLLLAGP